MGNLLKKVLWYEENKDAFSENESEIIKKDLIDKCNAKIKAFSSVFLDAIDKIND